MEKRCHVCTKEVGGAHKCIQCKKVVHLICGKTVENEEDSEEGYGQKVMCGKCIGNEKDGK